MLPCAGRSASWDWWYHEHATNRAASQPLLSLAVLVPVSYRLYLSWRAKKPLIRWPCAAPHPSHLHALSFLPCCPPLAYSQPLTIVGNACVLPTWPGLAWLGIRDGSSRLLVLEFLVPCESSSSERFASRRRCRHGSAPRQEP